MKNKSLYDAIENYKATSAWNKGLKIFALEIVESTEKYITIDNVKEIILNGAESYHAASFGGNFLITAKKNPNARESWLDLQARAAFQVEFLIKKAILKGSTIKSWK